MVSNEILFEKIISTDMQVTLGVILNKNRQGKYERLG